MNETSGTNEEEAFNAEAAAEKIIVSAEEAALSGLQSGGDEMESMEVALAPLEGSLDSNGNEVGDTDKSTTNPAYAETEAIDVPLRPEEKKRLRWEGGLYLAPLTTVGNLVSARVRVRRGRGAQLIRVNHSIIVLRSTPTFDISHKPPPPLPLPRLNDHRSRWSYPSVL